MLAPAKAALKHEAVSSYPDGIFKCHESTAVRNNPLYKSTAAYKKAPQSAIVHSKNPPHKLLGESPGHNQLSKNPLHNVLSKYTAQPAARAHGTMHS